MKSRFLTEATARELPLRYSSVDLLLGDARGRFFGNGYRFIRSKVSRVRLDGERRELQASASIEYPSSWSTKRDRELEPHLSSLDALGVAAQLAEAYLRTTFGFAAAAADSMRLTRSALKPGPAPTTDLGNVEVRCSLLDTAPAGNGRAMSRFTARVGTIGVQLSVEHPLPAAAHVTNASWEQLSDVLGPPELCYYGSAYTATKLDVVDVLFDESGERVSATIDMLPPPNAPALSGLAAAAAPFFSEMTAIVSIAQLAQALLYRYDDVKRGQSNNLWMRKILIVSERSVPASRGMHVETWSKKMTLLPVKEGLWRTATFEYTAPGLTGEYTVAHLLPGHLRSSGAPNSDELAQPGAHTAGEPKT
jgi:hypothetical protein